MFTNLILKRIVRASCAQIFDSLSKAVLAVMLTKAVRTSNICLKGCLSPSSILPSHLAMAARMNLVNALKYYLLVWNSSTSFSIDINFTLILAMQRMRYVSKNLFYFRIRVTNSRLKVRNPFF